MKLVMVSEEEFTIYLKDVDVQALDFSDKAQLERYFKKIFLNLKNHYQMPLRGFYDIRFFVDPQNGGVIEATKEIEEFFQVFDEKVDMKITCTLDCTFFYQITDYFMLDAINRDDFDIYYYEGLFYLKPKHELDLKTRFYLSEFATICYGDKQDDVVLHGKKL